MRNLLTLAVAVATAAPVVERYELSEDGTHILLEFMLEDPEYFMAPMTHST